MGIGWIWSTHSSSWRNHIRSNVHFQKRDNNSFRFCYSFLQNCPMHRCVSRICLRKMGSSTIKIGVVQINCRQLFRTVREELIQWFKCYLNPHLLWAFLVSFVWIRKSWFSYSKFRGLNRFSNNIVGFLVLI